MIQVYDVLHLAELGFSLTEKHISRQVTDRLLAEEEVEAAAGAAFMHRSAAGSV